MDTLTFSPMAEISCDLRINRVEMHPAGLQIAAWGEQVASVLSFEGPPTAKLSLAAQPKQRFQDVTWAGDDLLLAGQGLPLEFWNPDSGELTHTLGMEHALRPIGYQAVQVDQVNNRLFAVCMRPARTEVYRLDSRVKQAQFGGGTTRLLVQGNFFWQIVENTLTPLICTHVSEAKLTVYRDAFVYRPPIVCYAISPEGDRMAAGWQCWCPLVWHCWHNSGKWWTMLGIRRSSSLAAGFLACEVGIPPG